MSLRDTAEYPMFSRTEMDRRYARAREAMAARGIDALLVTGEENFQYFTGGSASLALHYSNTRPSVLILPLERDPIIVTQSKHYIVAATYVADFREYVDLLQFPHGLVVDALEGAGLRHGRVGAELGQEQRMGIPVGAYLNVAAALPRVEFVDAADIVIRLRMVKSEEELRYMRKAAEVTGRARQRLFDRHIVSGMTERDVARAMRRLILEEGGDRTSFVHLQLDLPGCKNQFHYERPLRRGTVLAVDTGAYVWMYTVDYPRMATLGASTELQRRAHRAVRDVNQQMADALRPGVRCSELHRLAVQAIEKAGATVDEPAKLSRGRMGHGQGMLVTEPPSITPADHTVLEPGMVISTEPGLRMGDVHYLWEDVHVITEEGHEQLTLETPELREIPF
jgi:Xaa-Pro aminopeptidase